MSAVAAVTSRALSVRSIDQANEAKPGNLSSPSEVSEQSLEESLRKLAYALWEQRGSPEGSSDADWIEAERQIETQRGSSISAVA